MAQNQLIDTLLSLRARIDNLLQERRELREKVEMLEEKNIELERRHSIHIEMLERVSKDSEFLSMSHRLADNPDNLISSRRKISQMIRTVDKCIRLLNEE